MNVLTSAGQGAGSVWADSKVLTSVIKHQLPVTADGFHK